MAQRILQWDVGAADMRGSEQVLKGVAKRAFVVAAGIVLIVAVILAGWYFDSGVTAPNVVGLSVDEAAAALHEAGISIDTHGAEGVVTGQHPTGGEQWFRYQDFVLTYTDDSGTHAIGGPSADR